jgi:hypothetical protein
VDWGLIVAYGLLHGPQVFISLPLPHDREALTLFLLGGADDYASLSEFSAEEVPPVLRSAVFYEETGFSPGFCLLVRHHPTRQEVSQRGESGDGPNENHLVEQGHPYCSARRGGRANAVAAFLTSIPRQQARV